MAHVVGHLVIIVLGISLFQTGNGCQTNSSIPVLGNLQNRTLDDIYDGSLIDNNDANIKADWYRAVADGTQYQLYVRRANDTVDYGTCGAYYPVYLMDQLPDFGSLTEIPLEMEGCLFDKIYPCDVKYTLKIRRCGNEVQYFLPPTRRFAGYCFVPSWPVPTTAPTTRLSTTESTAHVADTSSSQGPLAPTSSLQPAVSVVPDPKDGDNSTLITTIIALVVLLLIVSIIAAVLCIRHGATKRVQDDPIKTNSVKPAVIAPEEKQYDMLYWDNSVLTASSGYTSINDVSDTATIVSTLSVRPDCSYECVSGRSPVSKSSAEYDNKMQALSGQFPVCLEGYLIPARENIDAKDRVYDIIE